MSTVRLFPFNLPPEGSDFAKFINQKLDEFIKASFSSALKAEISYPERQLAIRYQANCIHKSGLTSDKLLEQVCLHVVEKFKFPEDHFDHFEPVRKFLRKALSEFLHLDAKKSTNADILDGLEKYKIAKMIRPRL